MSKIIDFARQQVGEPYVFGASGMDKWDCSGLTKRAASQIGLDLYYMNLDDSITLEVTT